MMAIQIIGLILLTMGLIFFLIEILGVFRMKYVLNRMHVAAIGDTLGLALSMAGLMLLSGWNFTTLKFLLVIIFVWFTSPVSSHLIAGMALMTDDKKGHYEEVKDE